MVSSVLLVSLGLEESDLDLGLVSEPVLPFHYFINGVVMGISISESATSSFKAKPLFFYRGCLKMFGNN